jgi:hypothetical protein
MRITVITEFTEVDDTDSDGARWRNLLLALFQLWVLLPELVKLQLQFIMSFADQHQRSYQHE